jgi:hypothetical protein
MVTRKSSVLDNTGGGIDTTLTDRNTRESLVVYVHGIGLQEAQADLKLKWDLALFGRDLNARSRMAYWSDILHWEALSAKKTARLAAAAESDADFDLEEVIEQLPDTRQREFARDLAQRVGATASTMRRGPAKKITGLPAWARKPLSRAFLKAFISDTASYFFDAALRKRIRQRLIDQLQLPKGQQITIVAHSQGSVIAYEVLSALQAPPFTLDALITLGSPLGIEEVQDFLEPKGGTIPPVVSRWYNFADPLDPVAFDKWLASDFHSHDGKVEIQDEVIVSTQSRKLWGFNPHAAIGYLTHPSVRRVVNDAMRMDKLARFVIARDVAERLGASPDERHSVLIEALEPGYRALGETPEELSQREQMEAGKIPTAPHQTGEITLEWRVQTLATELWEMLEDPDAAEIDPLRRFVSARLTAIELQKLCARHETLRVYAVWQSSRKSKLTDRRSISVIKSDGALHSFSANGRGITWAVLDTGVQANHPHFLRHETIAAVYDCTRQGPPQLLTAATDPDGHGTHVSGIIAGQSADGIAVGPENQQDLRGIAPLTRLVVYKVLRDDGQGEDAWIIKAIDHIAQMNENIADGLAIHGVNLSLGGPFDSTVYGCGFSPICTELRRLWRNGVLVVVACGNEGQLQVQTPDGDTEINTAMSVGDPANLHECIAVGSVNADRPHLYGVSSFSSRGPTADGRAKPDVVAPGERILSCNSHWRANQNNQYYYESGTSMAAPHVSGMLAAFLSVRREFRGRPDEVKQLLLDGCIDLGRDRYHQGRGLPNLMEMLLRV